MSEAHALAAPAVGRDWRRLSPWSVVHFAARAVVENLRVAIFGGGGGAYGMSQSNFAEYAWTVPLGLIALVVIGAVVSYLTCYYRLHADVVEVRRGLLFKKLTNLPFARVQNIAIEHPFYFRPLGLVTLKIDGAGDAREEVVLAALEVDEAESLRAYVAAKRRAADGLPAPAGEAAETETRDRRGEIVLTRSVGDLIVHGLTNNRSYLILAGVAGVIGSNVGGDFAPIGDWWNRIGIDLYFLDGLGLVGFALLAVVGVMVAGAVVALLSVLGAVVIYYGFTIRRVDDALVIERGLLTRHEILVRKSRIQTVIVEQDWLERLIERRNLVLEQISHRRPLEDGDLPKAREKIVVPAVRVVETEDLAGEIPELTRLDELTFTPISRRYFRKHAAIASAIYVVAIASTLLPFVPAFGIPIVLAVWPLHLVVLHLQWKRAGIAIRDGFVVARSGTIGVDYRVFPAYKLQQVSHVQTPFMRRHGVSNVIFRTASSTVRVPYLPTPFARTVVDYCAYEVESDGRSWM